MRSWGGGVHLYVWYPCKREDPTWRQTHRGRWPHEAKQKLEWCGHRPRNAWATRSCKQQGRPKSSLPTLWSWTSSLQNGERIHFCVLHHSVCGTLLWHCQETDKSLLSLIDLRPCPNITALNFLEGESLPRKLLGSTANRSRWPSPGLPDASKS